MPSSSRPPCWRSACAPARRRCPGAPASATTAAPTGFTDDQLAQIDAAATKSLVNGMTGAVVSVVDPARGTLLKAYGSADTAGTPLRPDAHYRIASVTKTFTAYAVLRLVDEGKVALTDPISRYVADIPDGDTITVRDLLAMRSGGYDFTDDKAFFDRYLAEPDDAVDRRRHAGDHPRPRCGVHAAEPADDYNNSNYVLLGLVIAKASGQPAPQYLDGLIRELGLPATSYPSDDALPEPVLHGYLGDGASPAPPGRLPRRHREQPGGRRRRGRHGLHRPGHGALRRPAGRRHRPGARHRGTRQTGRR